MHSTDVYLVQFSDVHACWLLCTLDEIESMCTWYCLLLLLVYQARPISPTHWELESAQLSVSERNWSNSRDYVTVKVMYQ